MKKQYAVLGLGSFGRSVALTLENMGCDVIVVDNSMEKIQEIADSVSYAMCASVEDPEVLRSLGAKNLDGVIMGVSENLEVSIMATILAKENGVPYVLAKAQNELHGTILKKVGADAIIYPEEEMGAHVARGMVSTNFSEWIELSPDYSMVELEVPEDWAGRDLIELKIRERFGINIVAIFDGERVEVRVDPTKPLPAGGKLIMISDNYTLQKFQKD